jgi:hypothetical protein
MAGNWLQVMMMWCTVGTNDTIMQVLSVNGDGAST